MIFSSTGFDWDKGNLEKNWKKPKVTKTECEEIFFNQRLIVLEDIEHSQRETHWFALGKTNDNRQLFIAFILRGSLIRVISARIMSKTERSIYAKKDTKI